MPEHADFKVMLIVESTPSRVVIEGCVHENSVNGSRGILSRPLYVVGPRESFWGHTFEELRAMGLTSVGLHPIEGDRTRAIYVRSSD